MATRKQKQRRDLISQDQKEIRKKIPQPLQQEIHAEIQKQVSQQVRQVVSQISVKHHSGPLPPADEAAKYQQLCPDFVSRTLAITETAQKADIKLISRAQSFVFWKGIIALLSATGIILSTLYWSYLMFKGEHHWLRSIAPFFTGLATIASVFWGAGKHNEKAQKRDAKRESFH